MIDDGDEFLQFFPDVQFVGRYLLIADVQQILGVGVRYLEGLVGFDHIVECIDGQIVVDDFLLAFVVLVGEFEVDVYYLLDLLARLLNFEEGVEYLMDHVRVEDVVFTLLEVVLL